MDKHKTPKPEAGEALHKPTALELAALDRVYKTTSEAGPRIKVSNNGTAPMILPDHPTEDVGYCLLMEAIGTSNTDFAYGLLGQLGRLGMKGLTVDEVQLQFLVAVVKGVKPKSEVEAMLAAQMAVVHMASMKFARQLLAQVGNIPQQDGAENAFNKLTRTYVAQMDALKRYRTGGEQKVTVQYVSVNDGAQAIVGNVMQGARAATPPKSANKTPVLTDARQVAMPMVDEREQARVPLRRKKKNGAQTSA